MTETQKCVICFEQWRDGYVCKGCVKKARTNLATIRELMAHVDEKRARWTGIDYRKGPSRSAETPLPYDPRVTKVTHPVVNGLLTLHNVICEGRGWHLALPVGSTVSQVTAWVDVHLDWLAGQPEGEEEFRFLRRSAEALAALFDRPPDRLYLGQCRTVHGDDEGEYACEAYVYVENKKPLAPQAKCPRCHALIEVSTRRDEFAEAVQHYQATMRELTRLAPMFLEEGVTRYMLQEWTRHGLLRPVGERTEMGADAKWRGVPTYRIGALADARKAWEARKVDRADTRRRKSA